MWRTHLIGIVGMTLLLSGTFAFAADDQATDVTARPVHVAMFKNGVALVRSDAELPQPAGQYRLGPLPPATLGSFWLTWPDGMSLTDVTATTAMGSETVAAVNIAELLEANLGRTVDLKIQGQWERAKILDIPRRQDGPVILPRSEDVIPPPPPRPRGDLLLLGDSIGVRAIPRSWVQEVRLDPDDPHYTLERPKQQNVIEFSAQAQGDGDAGPASISLTYLAQGMAWSPSYVVDISDDEHAQFAAKAVIVNDLVALEETDVELIAGFPHIQFSDTPSMFSLTPLQQVLQQLRRRRGGQAQGVRANVMMQRADFAEARAPMPSMPTTPVMGEQAEDLYFYQVKAVTLKKGERGYFPMFTAQVPYEHIYTWVIADPVDQADRYNPRQGEFPQIVWHSLRLSNSTAQPWTTAPGMTMQNGRILGQKWRLR